MKFVSKGLTTLVVGMAFASQSMAAEKVLANLPDTSAEKIGNVAGACLAQAFSPELLRILAQNTIYSYRNAELPQPKLKTIRSTGAFSGGVDPGRYGAESTYIISNIYAFKNSNDVYDVGLPLFVFDSPMAEDKENGNVSVGNAQQFGYSVFAPYVTFVFNSGDKATNVRIVEEENQTLPRGQLYNEFTKTASGYSIDISAYESCLKQGLSN